MSQSITCISVGVYKNALTRGRRYDLLAHDEQKRKVRVRGDNNRTRWFLAGSFDLSGGPAPTLVEWRFDDPVQNALNGRDETNNWVEVSFELSDGTKRWCSLTTPDYLKQLLESRVGPNRPFDVFDPRYGARI